MRFRLWTSGWHDEGESDAICCLVIFDVVQDKTVWESESYDTHPDEYADSVKELRSELEEVLPKYGLSVYDVLNYDSNCIYDWSFNET